MVKNLIMIRDTTFKIAAILPQIRKLVGTPVNVTMRVDYHSFFDELAHQDFLGFDVLFAVLQTLHFFDSLGRSEAREKLRRHLAASSIKVLSFGFFFGEDKVFRKAWEEIYSQ